MDTRPTIAVIAEYRRFQAAALRAARRYDLSEASYEAFCEALITLEKVISPEKKIGWQEEEAFSQAATEVLGSKARLNYTINQILGIASEKHNLRDFGQNVDALLSRLVNGGAILQPLWGCLVLADVVEPPLPSDAGQKRLDPTFASKTAELVTMLLSARIHADDMIIYRGGVHRNMRRKVPYTVFEIKKLNRQIAVCDQIGEIAFVSQSILPVSDWGNMTKRQLESHPDIHPVRYTRSSVWLDKIKAIILTDESGSPIDIGAVPKIKLSQMSRMPLLTEAQIREWIVIFHELEEKWPSTNDKIVWHRLSDENLQPIKETWMAINDALNDGWRGLPGGSSVYKFRIAHGLCDPGEIIEFDKEQVKKWITLFREKERKLPSRLDEVVWKKNEQGNWCEVAGLKWSMIDASKAAAPSLAQFKIDEGFSDNLKIEQILRWLALFPEKLKFDGEDERWPALSDKAVWDKDAKGVWFRVIGETWNALDLALARGSRGLPGGTSLLQLRRDHDLDRDFFRDRAVELVNLYREKTREDGHERFPTSRDKDIWVKRDGQWQLLPGRNWAAINEKLRARGRGLSLAKLRGAVPQ